MEQFSLPITHINSVTPASNLGKLQRTQKQLEEVIEIVRSDIDRMIEREGRLQNLTARTDVMEARAEQFSRKAVRVRRNMWWRSVRVMMSIAAACAVLIVGVVGEPFVVLRYNNSFDKREERPRFCIISVTTMLMS